MILNANGQQLRKAMDSWNNQELMRVIAGGQQVYPNGIHIPSRRFTTNSGYVEDDTNDSRLAILNPYAYSQTPTLATNQTINEVSGRVYSAPNYKNEPSYWGWTDFDPGKGITISSPASIEYINTGTIVGPETFTSYSFNFPANDNYDMEAYLQVERKLQSPSNYAANQPNNMYFYIWKHGDTVANNLFNPLTIPAKNGIAGTNTVDFFSQSFSFGGSNEARMFYLAMAMVPWHETRMSLSLSLHWFKF